MKQKRYKFLARWAASSSGLWLAVVALGAERVSVDGGVSVLLMAGFILAGVNTIVRPIAIFMTLPALLFSLGVFMLVINALMVLLADWLYGPLEVNGFWTALIVGIFVGLLNWLISVVIEEDKN